MSTQKFSPLEWLRSKTKERIDDYKEYLEDHPAPRCMVEEEYDKVTTVIEVLESVLEDVESVNRAVQPWISKGSMVDFHLNMASDEVTTPNLRILSDVVDLCGSLYVRVEKEGLVCVNALTPAGGDH
jgi:hypothetical protein